jgi:hypothetical protein
MLIAKKPFITVLIFSILTACALKKQEGPCTETAKLTGGRTFTSDNGGGNRPLPGSPYGYEIWSAGGKNNKLIWFGPDQGGGAAFRAEWNNPNDFLGRVGYFGMKANDMPNIKMFFAILILPVPIMVPAEVIHI